MNLTEQEEVDLLSNFELSKPRKLVPDLAPHTAVFMTFLWPAAREQPFEIVSAGGVMPAAEMIVRKDNFPSGSVTGRLEPYFRDAGRLADITSCMPVFVNEKTFHPLTKSQRRYVHARRARILRRRGEHVGFAGFRKGRAVYTWLMDRGDLAERRP